MRALSVIGALVVLAVLGAQGGVEGRAASAATKVASDTTAPAALSAGERARVSGEPVEVEAQTTENSRTLANPDGTFVTEFAAGPVRVRQGGGWTPVDTTLVVSGDGSIRPRAAAASISLSGGGRDPWLAEVSKDGRSFALGWKGRLAAPRLQGDTATYAGVLPGVDLQVTVGSDSFTERLIVRDAQAAANPALKTLTFPVRVSEGLSLKKSSAGGFSVVGAAGQQLFVGPQPLMWDSTSARALRPLASSQASGEAGGADSPEEGDQVIGMPLTVNGQSVAVTPSIPMLTAASTTFPVTVDPGVFYSATRNGWAMVNATYPTASYWKFTGDEGMGYNTTSGTNKKRLFYMFSTSAINSKRLIGATFKAFETFSYSCTESTVQAYQTSAISSASTWNNQPAWVKLNDSVSAAHGRDGCDPGGQWVSFDVLSAVTASKAAGGSNTTIGLKAASETSNWGWKRFRPDATLSVTYNTPPATPTSLRTTYPTTSCVTGAGRPVIAMVDPPTLNATVNDSDGGKGQAVRADFQVSQISAAGDYALRWSASTAYKAPGVAYTANVPSLSDGTYAWRARAYDGIDVSAWSGFCEFTVDGTAPIAPTVTTPTAPPAGSCLVLPDAKSNDEANCSAGDTGSFTVVPGDPSTTKFRWSLNSQLPTSTLTSVTSPDFSVTFDAFGPNLVRVWGYDNAGNVSQPGDLEFRVRGATPNGWWRMDEATGALSDTSAVSTTHPLTRVGVTTSVPGMFSPEASGQDPPFSDPTDRAVTFDGVSGSANSSGAVLPMGRSITLSAWVKLDTAVTSRRYLLSQDMGTSSWSIGLFADPPVTCAQDANGVQIDPYCVPFQNGRFGMAVNDGTRALAMYSQKAVAPGEWTQIVGVYNPGLQDAQMTLYVGGEFDTSLGASTVPRQTTSTAVGPLRVGSLLSSTVRFWWPGTVDEVQTFAGAYDKDQVDRLFRQTRP